MIEPLADALIERFEAHHARLRKAIAGLDGTSLERVLAPDTSSIAVIVTHVMGSELGWLHAAAGRPYSRDRAAEFRARGKSSADLEATIERTAGAMPDLVRAAIAGGLATMRKSGEREVSAAWALVHALDHLTEHVGQLELTRQLVTRD